MSLNTEHKVTLTEGQISTILYTLEEKVAELDNFDENEELREDIDSIFEILEGVVDKYYDKVAEARSKQPTAEWED